MTDTKLEEMSYQDLKKLANERGLNASGTKDVLIERLKGSEGPKTDQNESSEPVEESPVPKVDEKAEEAKANVQLKADAQKMKDHLDKQPKVSMMIPFEVGENAEVGKNIPFHVNLNGYKMDIPRGVYVELPRQVAELIKERLESEGKIGSEWRIDRDAKKQEALG